MSVYFWKSKFWVRHSSDTLHWMTSKRGYSLWTQNHCAIKTTLCIKSISSPHIIQKCISLHSRKQKLIYRILTALFETELLLLVSNETRYCSYYGSKHSTYNTSYRALRSWGCGGRGKKRKNKEVCIHFSELKTTLNFIVSK